ncbi:MAG: trans-acting enoyl reductase family protein [Mycobacteriales bacterium]|nr:NAD(P)H-binding protein [Frankia sp.]
MAGRIVLFGATGYTGRLTAEALARRGGAPVLAGRNREKLLELATQLGGLDTAVADVAAPESVLRLVGDGDVLVTTVGPFAEWGEPAVRAAISGRAAYLDSTGEPGFIRRVFEQWGPEAAAAGVGLVTAFGYDYVPGNLAGALALRQASDAATRVDVGYFVTGSGGPSSMSSGTVASMFGSGGGSGFAFRDGAIVDDRIASSVRSFVVDGDTRDAIALGTSEHFTLPRLAPSVRDVGGYLGWFGALSRPVQTIAAGAAAVQHLPGVETALKALMKAMPKPSPGTGPDAESRARSGSHVVAVASDASGQVLAEVHVAGVNGYTFTAEILAWGALHAQQHGLDGAGALGPVEAFGLDALQDGCASAGLSVVG